MAVAALLATAVPSAALAYTSTGTSYPLGVIDNGPGAQQDPRMSASYTAYTDDQGGATARIEYYRNFWNIGIFPFRGAVPTAANAIDFQPDVDGFTIVFTRLSSSGSAIYEYSLISETLSEVAPVTAPAVPDRRNPATGASTIVWEDAGAPGASANEPDLVLVNGSTTFRLTTDALADRNPNVSPDGGMIAWEKCAGTCDVYAAAGSGSAWVTTPVATGAADQIWPDTNGNQIVYASNAGGAYHVYATTLGGVPTKLSVPGSVSENHPAIAGNFVAFESSNGAETDIWVYDLATNVAHRITDTPESETLADVTNATDAGNGQELNVVWQVIEADSNVYGSFVPAESQPSFTDHFLQPLTESSDPANPVLNTGKNGKVIPVKVQLSQGGTAITDTNAPGPVTIAVSKLASCSTSAGSDPIATYADAGQSSAGTNQFRYDAATQAWVYNLDTKALGLVTGNCYRIDVSVNGSQVTNAFAVFQPTK